MNAKKLLGVVFIAAGTAALIYHGFTYTKSHDERIGPVELSFKDQQRVDIPIWAGAVIIVAGTGLLVAGSRRG